MRTIKDNLIRANQLLKEDKVMSHINACNLVFMDLSAVKGFDKDVLSVLAYYQQYLLDKHKSVKKVGWYDKIKGYLKSKFTKKKVNHFLNKCQSKKFGDGDLYLQQIFIAIRKAL